MASDFWTYFSFFISISFSVNRKEKKMKKEKEIRCPAFFNRLLVLRQP